MHELFLHNIAPKKFNYIYFRILSGKPEANALLRTTTAVTMFNAGIKVSVKNIHMLMGCVETVKIVPLFNFVYLVNVMRGV